MFVQEVEVSVGVRNLVLQIRSSTFDIAGSQPNDDSNNNDGCHYREENLGENVWRLCTLRSGWERRGIHGNPVVADHRMSEQAVVHAFAIHAQRR